MQRKRIQHRHGLALVIVLTVVGMASLIGLAMLSGAALQEDVAHNSVNAATADYMAESAVQTAAYFLQHNLANMPSTWGTTSGYTIFAQNVTISGVSGSFDVDASTTTSPDDFQVYAVGRSSGNSPATRSISAKIHVIRATPTYSVGANGALSIDPGNYTTGASAVITGALNLVNSLSLGAGSASNFGSLDFNVPTLATGINYYGGSVASGTYVTPSGIVGTPQVLASGTISSTASLTANASNPGRVFYYPGNVVITAGGTYNGTLIARGSIQIKTPLNSSITFNRQAGFPALVSDGNLYINAKNLTANINGVVWAGGGTSFNIASTACNFKINGALLMPGGVSMGTVSLGSLSVNYTAANTDIYNLTAATQPGIGIKYTNWQQ